MRFGQLVHRSMGGFDALPCDEPAFAYHARSEPAYAVACTNLIILVTTIDANRVRAVRTNDLPVGGTVSVGKSYCPFFWAVEAFRRQDEGVIETTTDDERRSDGHHLVGVLRPIGPELL